MLNDNSLYDVEFSYETVENVTSSLKKITEIMSGYPPETRLENMSENDRDEVIYRSEKIDLSCRKSAAYRDGNSSNFEQENHETASDFFPETSQVFVSFADEILTVKTPLTLKRFGKESNEKYNSALT